MLLAGLVVALALLRAAAGIVVAVQEAGMLDFALGAHIVALVEALEHKRLVVDIYQFAALNLLPLSLIHI